LLLFFPFEKQIFFEIQKWFCQLHKSFL
jgi:hypothetical protein